MAKTVKTKKNKKWSRPRHTFYMVAARPVMFPFIHKRYHLKTERMPDRNLFKKGRPYLILYNHETAYDQFFISAAFKAPVYYVASEDIFSLGLLSKLMFYSVRPIPIKKQVTDAIAVRTCLKVAREGKSVAIAPEGNRTFDGGLCKTSKAIVSLARHMKLPIALYRIENGYGVDPRWGSSLRKGQVVGKIAGVIEKEAYDKMTDDELYEKIVEGLTPAWTPEIGENPKYVSGSEKGQEMLFTSDKKAEYIERLLYTCPTCGFSEFESTGDEFRCKKCKRKAKYTEKCQIDGNFQFTTVKKWVDFQNDFVLNNIDYGDFSKIYFEEPAKIARVFLGKNKEELNPELAKTARLFADRIEIDPGAEAEKILLDFENCTGASIVGRNKCNFYVKNGDSKEAIVYQITGGDRFNAVKYVNFYYAYKLKDLEKGEKENAFLGF